MTWTSPLTHADPRLPDPAAARRGFDTAAAAARRAAAFVSGEDAKTANAVERLHRLLADGTPPRANVPLGYYLDITV
jgi:hypothetical protein